MMLVTVLTALTLLCMEARGMSLSEATRTIPGFLPKSDVKLLTLRLTGIVEEGDAAKVRSAFQAAKAAADREQRLLTGTVELSSAGGDVLEGIALGYLFRELRLPTMVRSSDSCLSACALAFLGGTVERDGTAAPSRSIEFGGQVGFHNISLNYQRLRAASTGGRAKAANEAFELTRGATALLVRYASDMGVKAPFIAELLGRPPTEMRFIDTVAEFIQLQTCPVGSPPPLRIEPRQQALNICVNAAGLRGQFEPSQSRTIPAREVKERLLQRSIGAADGKSSRIAGHLAALKSTNDSRLLSETYEALREVGVPLLDISGATFEVSGLPIAGGRLSCFVSAAASDANRYDVAFSNSGVAVQRAPADCRWLMRQAPDEIINPPRASTFTRPTLSSAPVYGLSP